MSETSFGRPPTSRPEAAQGLIRQLDLVAATRAEQPHVWAEVSVLYEVAHRLGTLFHEVSAALESDQTEAGTEMRWACQLAGRRLERSCRTLESAWISQYTVSHQGNTAETATVVEMRKAA